MLNPRPSCCEEIGLQLCTYILPSNAQIPKLLLSQLLIVATSSSDLQEIWWMTYRFDCPGIDGDNGDNDTGEEKGRQLVDIFDSHKNHNSHKAQANGTIDSHVVQRGTVTTMMVGSMEDSCLRD